MQIPFVRNVILTPASRLCQRHVRAANRGGVLAAEAARGRSPSERIRPRRGGAVATKATGHTQERRYDAVVGASRSERVRTTAFTQKRLTSARRKPAQPATK